MSRAAAARATSRTSRGTARGAARCARWRRDGQDRLRAGEEDVVAVRPVQQLRPVDRLRAVQLRAGDLGGLRVGAFEVRQRIRGHRQGRLPVIRAVKTERAFFSVKVPGASAPSASQMAAATGSSRSCRQWASVR